MAETTVLKTLMQFVHTVIDVYEKSTWDHHVPTSLKSF
jgi:hypothetical protein